MKREDLKKCAICKEGLAHGGSPMFYRIKIESMILNLQALQEQAGLEIMLGSPDLAHVMGPDRDIATKAGGNEVLICLECGTSKPYLLARLMEL